MRGVWHKKCGLGLIDWEATGDAVEYVVECLAALTLGMVDEKSLRSLAQEILSNVEINSKDSRHL